MPRKIANLRGGIGWETSA